MPVLKDLKNREHAVLQKRIDFSKVFLLDTCGHDSGISMKANVVPIAIVFDTMQTGIG